MRPLLVSLSLSLAPVGCSLAEYVLPAGTSGPGSEGPDGGAGSDSDDHGASTGAGEHSGEHSGDAPTLGETGGSDDTGPGDTGGAEDTGGQGDTGETGGPGDTGTACGDGLDACGEDCVDLGSDEAHCGSCVEVCKADEQCIAAECRDILPVECLSCPCAACGGGEGEGGLLADSDTDTGGGDTPQQYLCCPPAAEGEPVLCVTGHPEDVLTCPEVP